MSVFHMIGDYTIKEIVKRGKNIKALLFFGVSYSKADQIITRELNKYQYIENKLALTEDSARYALPRRLLEYIKGLKKYKTEFNAITLNSPAEDMGEILNGFQSYLSCNSSILDGEIKRFQEIEYIDSLIKDLGKEINADAKRNNLEAYLAELKNTGIPFEEIDMVCSPPIVDILKLERKSLARA